VDIILFDMANLRFARHGSPGGDRPRLRVETPHVGVLLETALDEDVTRREAVFRGLDEMLASLELPTSTGSWCQVALYNPLTFQVSYRPVPETVVYTDGRPLEIPPVGLMGRLDDDVMTFGHRELGLLLPSARSTGHALAAHAAT